jgi:hypothetical protein
MKRIASFVVIWHDFTIIFHAASLFIILNQETPVVAMPISESHVERNILLLPLSQLNVIVVSNGKIAPMRQELLAPYPPEYQFPWTFHPLPCLWFLSSWSKVTCSPLLMEEIATISNHL